MSRLIILFGVTFTVLVGTSTRLVPSIVKRNLRKGGKRARNEYPGQRK